MLKGVTIASSRIEREQNERDTSLQTMMKSSSNLCEAFRNGTYLPHIVVALSNHGRRHGQPENLREEQTFSLH